MGLTRILDDAVDRVGIADACQTPRLYVLIGLRNCGESCCSSFVPAFLCVHVECSSPLGQSAISPSGLG